MTLDVIVPTYNRRLLLDRLLESLQRAGVPPELAVRVIVVDNNSSDGTKDTVRTAQQRSTRPIEYVFEPRQGKSYALNTALERVTADLVGFLDDDEEVDLHWFETANDAFRDESVSFISGPYRPNWGGAIPGWLPPQYPAAIGWVDAGPTILEYGKDYAGTMLGGNAVIRRSALEKVGGFKVELCRTGSAPCGCEDVDLFQRLLAIAAKGLYVPDLVIFHYIPPERLTKTYYRQWCRRHAVLQARIHSDRPQAVAYLLGVPRYMFGKAARAVPVLLRAAATGRWHAPETFSSELAIWDLWGFLRGTLFTARLEE